MTKLFYIGALLLGAGLVASLVLAKPEPPIKPEPPLGVVMATKDEIPALEEAYFAKYGKYLQIKEGNRLPDYETGTVRAKLGKDLPDDVFVHTHKYPNGTWGYTIYTVPPIPALIASTTP